jgi:hypothetical protein
MNAAARSIKDLLGWLASGGTLRDEDLVELDLEIVDREAVEKRVREAAEQITTARRAGLRGDARTIARDTANELAVALRGEQEPAPTREEIDALIAGVHRN